jgi:excisionase family DNA binding protein
MYLSVQLAARRLGVSPHTIRRWTASGFLPCTRTAGGHRRIKQEDIDDLAHLIGGSNHLAARLARERELETLVHTSIAVSSQLELTELLAEIAKQMTSLLECHFCAISEYDPSARAVQVLADYDDLGNRRPDTMRYAISQFPMSKRVLENHEIVLVNISDPHADAAEIAIMRREGDKSLLILPMVYQGAAIGLIEVLDHVRERRYSRQEMRLATAIAGQAAVAMHNAKVFAQLRRSDRDVHSLCKAITRVTAALGTFAEQTTASGLLQSVAIAACASLEAISSVATLAGESAGASGAVPSQAAAGKAAQSQSNSAHVIVSSAPLDGDQLTITVTLPHEAGDGQAELLTLITTAATVALRSVALR